MKEDRWKNRRRMAWLCLIASLGYPFLILFTGSDQVGAISPHFYLFTSAIVLGYLGFATWDDIKFKDQQ